MGDRLPYRTPGTGHCTTTVTTIAASNWDAVTYYYSLLDIGTYWAAIGFSAVGEDHS